MAANEISTPVVNMGIPDRFIEQGNREDLLALCDLDAAGIIRVVEQHSHNLHCKINRTQLIS
jgi:1-deoxy-D-xylulose-5-phosphate synthase